MKCYDCGDDVANWLSDCLNRPDLRLVRQCQTKSRINKKGDVSQLSLANQSQYLLLNMASVRYLAESIPNFDGSYSNLVERFRANFVVESDVAFVENEATFVEIGECLFHVSLCVHFPTILQLIFQKSLCRFLF